MTWRTLARICPVFLLIVLPGCQYQPKASDAPEVARQAKPIIAALGRYHHDRNTYPLSLDDMVPSYLGVIPHPNLRTDRPYVLRYGDRPSDRVWTGNAPYAITVDIAPSGTLVYRPDHRYGDLSRNKPGGRPVDGWFLSNID